MKYQHIRRIFKKPFYTTLKKHFCPECHNRVDKIKCSRIVDSAASDARNFDFETIDGYMIGKVKFIWTEFKCPKCNKQMSIDEMIKFEQTSGRSIK